MINENEVIKEHDGAWTDGYYEGNPLDPYGRSAYEHLGYISMLHAIYQAFVKPYCHPGARVLEIGCGRGAWTKAMLSAERVWCLDAQSAEDNRFWEYVGTDQKEKVKYIKVADFSCSELPDNYFDFVFSFGTFCHIPWEGQELYYRNILPKMRNGANGVVMFADYDKYDQAVESCGGFGLSIKRPDENLIVYHTKCIAAMCRNLLSGKLNPCRIWTKFKPINRKEPGLWFSPGISNVAQFLTEIGWEVLNQDIGLCLRDPIVHFRKK